MIERCTTKRPCRQCGSHHGCCTAYPSRGKPFDLCFRVKSEYETPMAGYKHYIDSDIVGDYSENQKVIELASAIRRNIVYKELLDNSPLYEHHYDDLIRRGFTDSDIEKLGYKSVVDVTDVLVQKYTLDNVPGFYKKEGKWTMIQPQGYFIPVRAVNGKISGMQIRLDYPNKSMKYLWFSSPDRDMGAAVPTMLHHRIDNEDDLWIVEGLLKTDYLYFKKDYNCIGLAGTNYGSDEVVKFLLENNFNKLVIAYDNDWKINKFVRNSMNSLCRKITKLTDAKIQVATWDDTCGIDDALENDLKIELIEWKEN